MDDRRSNSEAEIQALVLRCGEAIALGRRGELSRGGEVAGLDPCHRDVGRSGAYSTSSAKRGISCNAEPSKAQTSKKLNRRVRR